MTEPTKPTRRPKKSIPDKATAAAYDAAWQAESPGPGPHLDGAALGPPGRSAAPSGKAARKRVPRVSHAAFEPAPGRDPIAILEAQEDDRLPDLVPLRHERMAESAFAYYRGTPAVMAFDLASTPRSDIVVQASGDAHLSELRPLRLPGAHARLRRQRLRRDAPRALGMGRQAAGGEHHHCRPGQRLQLLPRTVRRP